VTTALPEGTVTLLFTDVEKSTDLRTSRGDETAHALLQRQGDLVRAQIREHSGHEVKTMGDGFMVAFASARAPLHERRLVRALHGGGGACRPRREG
jgi:class 3 adenylate cyclase